MKLSRRTFLQATTAAAAGLATASVPTLAQPASKRKKLPVGLELWSVRDLCAKDLPGVLKAVAEAGYDGVEFAHSYYGHDAEAIRKLLDQNGLKSCGMHMTVQHLKGKALEETIRIHKVLDTPYLIVSSLPRKTMQSKKAILETAKWFNELAQQLKEHGMRVGYHCHAHDFDPLDGSTAWELIGENTNPEVILQLDTANCLSGGADPYAMLRKFPGRAVSVHLKEHGGPPGAVFGEGEVRWDEVFDICETIGGTKWYVIEDETRKGPAALEAVRRSLKNFRKLHG